MASIHPEELLIFINELIAEKRFNSVVRDFCKSKDLSQKSELDKAVESFKKYKKQLGEHILKNNPKLKQLKPYREIATLYEFCQNKGTKGQVFLPEPSEELSQSVINAMKRLSQKISDNLEV